MREKPLSVRELTRRVAELERGLERALQVAAAERARAEHFEAAYRASIRTALGTFTPPLRPPLRRPHPPAPARSCAHCSVRFEPRRKDARFCSANCQIAAWRKTHPDRRAHPPSGHQEDACANP